MTAANLVHLSFTMPMQLRAGQYSEADRSRVQQLVGGSADLVHMAGPVAIDVTLPRLYRSSQIATPDALRLVMRAVQDGVVLGLGEAMNLRFSYAQEPAAMT